MDFRSGQSQCLTHRFVNGIEISNDINMILFIPPIPPDVLVSTKTRMLISSKFLKSLFQEKKIFRKLRSLRKTLNKPKQCNQKFDFQFASLLLSFRFVVQLLYILPSLHGVLKQQCLETIASRVEHFDEPHHIFTELKNKGLESALNHR